jgi:NADH-quinone oxidoreductase subunit I
VAEPDLQTVGDVRALRDARRTGGTDVPSIVRAILAAMRMTLRNLWRKPVTVHYPTKTRVYPNRYRGLLALVYEKDTGEEACIGCRLCEFVCPPAVIKVEIQKGEKRNYAKTFTLELYACEFCELCVQVCPTDAIVMMKSFDMPTTDRREMLLDKDRLHAIGLQHEQSWATGNRLRDMQGPPKLARAEPGHAASADSPAGAPAPDAPPPSATDAPVGKPPTSAEASDKPERTPA